MYVKLKMFGFCWWEERESPFMFCASHRRSGGDKRLNLGLLWIICRIFVALETSGAAYSFNYTEGGLKSLKAERTKTATLKCWEHTTRPIKGQYPGHVITLDQSEASIQVTWSLLTNENTRPRHETRAQNNKLISSCEHLWTWLWILFGQAVQGWFILNT